MKHIALFFVLLCLIVVHGCKKPEQQSSPAQSTPQTVVTAPVLQQVQKAPLPAIQSPVTSVTKPSPAPVAEPAATLENTHITGTWCARDEYPGTGCYTFTEGGTVHIECPMCFSGTWIVLNNTIEITLNSPEQGPAGEPIQPVSFYGTMTLRDDGGMLADFPNGDGSGREGKWILYKRGGQ